MPRRPIPSRCRRCRGNGNYAVRRSRGFFTPRMPLWLLKRSAPIRHFPLPAFAGEVGTEIFGAVDFLVPSDSPALRSGAAVFRQVGNLFGGSQVRKTISIPH